MAWLPINAQQIIHRKSAYVVQLKRCEHFSFSTVLQEREGTKYTDDNKNNSNSEIKEIMDK